MKGFDQFTNNASAADCEETKDSGTRRVTILSGEMPVAPFPALWKQTRAGTPFGLTSGDISIGLNGMCQYELGCRVSPKSPKSSGFRPKCMPSTKVWVGGPGWLGGLVVSSVLPFHGSSISSGAAHTHVMEGSRPLSTGSAFQPGGRRREAASAQESPSPGSYPS